MKKRIKLPASPQPDAPLTASEVQDILLSADLDEAPKANEHDLMDEARRLRGEIREAKATKERLGGIWEKNRNRESSDAFGEAIDHYLDLQAHLKQLLEDLEGTRKGPDAPKKKRGKPAFPKAQS